MSDDDEDQQRALMEEMAEENQELQQRIDELESELYERSESGEITQYKTTIKVLEGRLRAALGEANTESNGARSDGDSKKLALMERQLENKRDEIVRLKAPSTPSRRRRKTWYELCAQRNLQKPSTTAELGSTEPPFRRTPRMRKQHPSTTTVTISRG